MKKSTWIYLILIAVCGIVFYGYQAVDSMANDKVSPKISINSEMLELSVNDSDEVLLTGISASDDKDGDITSNIIIEDMKFTGHNGKAKVTYAVFDKAGNAARSEREVTFTDYESPRFTLTSSLTFSQNSNFDVLNYVKVNDIFDGDISHRVRATALGSESVSSVGVHQVEFKVSSSMGDTVELVLPIEVYAQGAYNASLRLTDYIIYLDKDSEFDKNDYLKEFIIGSEKIDISAYLPSGFSIRTSGSVDTSVPGVYSVSYYATYNNTGNIGYTGFSKLIVVVEE